MSHPGLFKFSLSALGLIASGYLALFALGFFLLGDPGYMYRPTDAGGRPVDRWFETIEGVSLEGRFYETLIGESCAVYDVKPINATNKNVAVLDGELSTKGLTLKAYVPQGLRRTFPPVSSGEVCLRCDYEDHGRDASEVLGESITWTWHLRIGDLERTVQVRMVRE